MDSMVIVARLRLEDYRASLERLLGESSEGDHEGRQALEEVRAAIARINQGVYGTCERCGGAIGRQRLLALPAARFCIGCASAARSVEL